MAQVILRKTRFVVSPSPQNAVVKLIPVPETNIILALDPETLKALSALYREDAA